MEGYLECEEGAAFQLKVRINRPAAGTHHYGYQVAPIIDGRSITGMALQSTENTSTIRSMFVKEGGQTMEADLVSATMVSLAPSPSSFTGKSWSGADYYSLKQTKRRK